MGLLSFIGYLVSITASLLISRELEAFSCPSIRADIFLLCYVSEKLIAGEDRSFQQIYVVIFQSHPLQHTN